jgi:periodic tryptophan protein 2
MDPSGRLLVAVDEDGKALLISVVRRTVLHHFSFKEKVGALLFSPCGRYLAAACGRKVQIWRAPPLVRREFSPMVKLRQYGGHTDDIVSMDWSSDSLFLATGARDNTARIWTVDPLQGYVPYLFSGHRQRPVGVFFGKGDETLYTVTKDGAVCEWAYHPGEDSAPAAPAGGWDAPEEQEDELDRTAEGRYLGKSRGKRGHEEEEEEVEEEEVEVDEEEAEVEGDEGDPNAGEGAEDGADDDDDGRVLLSDALAASALRRRAFGKWTLANKYFFNQEKAVVRTCAFHAGTGLLVVGFSSGVFSLHTLPGFTPLHSLSISNVEIDACAINPTGEWLAFGCSALGQILVWEWRSETYILRQQGHAVDMNSAAYAPDGRFVATGGDDGKIKVWDTASGYCFVTFSEHQGSVTGLTFPSGGGPTLFSCSLDGSVRAFDLGRYRNFRTMVAPTPTQFSCLACDPAGEVVCAGAVDLFDIWVWSVQTGRLLDVLSGHEGPVSSLAFGPFRPVLVSGSWDRTVKVWEVFEGNRAATETFDHGSMVLSVAFRPDGRELASSGLDGIIMLWDLREATVRGFIEGRRDIAGGRKPGDLITKDQNSGTKHFSSISYSADGTALIAAGNSRFVCIYDAERRLLLKKYVVSQNVRLGGTLDYLGKRGNTEAGQLVTIDDDSGSEEKEVYRRRGVAALPGATRGLASKRRKERVVGVKCVRFSPTGRQWCAAATDGLLVYSLDEQAVFDPTDLDVDVTPDAARGLSHQGSHSLALLVALRLNEQDVLTEVLRRVPPWDIRAVAAAAPEPYIPRLIELLAVLASTDKHLQYERERERERERDWGDEGREIMVRDERLQENVK